MSDKSQNLLDESIIDLELKEQFKKVVLERIKVMPDTLHIAVGSDNLTKEDLVGHVKEEDEIGKQVIEMELEFMRGVASGAVYAND